MYSRFLERYERCTRINYGNIYVLYFTQNIENINTMPFKAGDPGGPGRPPGLKNKTTRIREEAFMQLAEGKEEIIEVIKTLAKGGEVPLLVLYLNKILPNQSMIQEMLAARLGNLENPDAEPEIEEKTDVPSFL